MLKSRFNIVDDMDLYEVRLNGHVIESIYRYLNGGQLRQEVEYSHLPEPVKEQLLDRVAQLLTE